MRTTDEDSVLHSIDLLLKHSQGSILVDGSSARHQRERPGVRARAHLSDILQQLQAHLIPSLRRVGRSGLVVVVLVRWHSHALWQRHLCATVPSSTHVSAASTARNVCPSSSAAGGQNPSRSLRSACALSPPYAEVGHTHRRWEVCLCATRRPRCPAAHRRTAAPPRPLLHHLPPLRCQTRPSARGTRAVRQGKRARATSVCPRFLGDGVGDARTSQRRALLITSSGELRACRKRR